MSTIHDVAATTTTELLDVLPALARHGDAVPYRYGGEVRVLVNEPSAIHRYLSTMSRREGGVYEVNKRMMGEGLLVTNTMDLWKPRRLLIQRELSPARVRIHEDSIIRRTRAAIESWEVGSEVAVRDEIGRIALANLGDAVFGGDFSQFGSSVQIALKLLVETGNVRESGRRDPDMEDELERQIVAMEQVVAAVTDREAPDDSTRGHVLDVLIRASQTDDPVFADPFVRDESITLMMAGHDTTAFLIAMSTFLLSRHPDVKERLAAEVKEARRAGLSSHEFVQAIPYARQVASETLRLYPPLPMSQRTAHDDHEVDGYLIEKDTSVTLSAWVTHRDPRYFPDPLRFDPERFASSNKANIARSTYFPFGMGQRVCAGNHFAMLETAIMTSLMAADVDLEFSTTEPALDSPVTLRFVDPLNAVVTRRS